MQVLRGTRDILPDEMIIWRYIYNKAVEICSLYNYKEIQTPIVEPTSLFIRSIGDATDIVNKEMYSFIDQGKRELTLRPEGTASIARSFISNKLYLNNSINKLWYWGPMFRYERPQSGRQRQFHQFGIECIGSIEPIADAEVIRIAKTLLEQLKLTQYRIEINSIGSAEERQKYQEKLINYLSKYKKDLDQDSQNRLRTNPLRILDSKDDKTQEILQQSPSLKLCLGKESKMHFNLLCQHLDQMHIEYYLNPKLVRGLDYYNYTAFEIKAEKLGSQNTICGGGRYDKLISYLGGPSTPSVGFAIGIERLLLVIKDQLKLTCFEPYIYIASQGTEAQLEIWNIVNILEKAQIRFEIDLRNNNFQKQIKKANKIGCQICLIIGNEEVENKYITVKYLKQHIQKRINYSELLATIEEYRTFNKQSLTSYR